MANNSIKTNDITTRARKYGFSSLFANIPLSEAERRLRYARSIKDNIGEHIAKHLVQNAEAYNKAKQELINERKEKNNV